MYLPLYKVADTPFHIQGKYLFLSSLRNNVNMWCRCRSALSIIKAVKLLYFVSAQQQLPSIKLGWPRATSQCLGVHRPRPETQVEKVERRLRLRSPQTVGHTLGNSVHRQNRSLRNISGDLLNRLLPWTSHLKLELLTQFQASNDSRTHAGQFSAQTK